MLLPPAQPILMPGWFLQRSSATITNGLANTKSAWQEVIASTTARAAFLIVEPTNTGTSGRAVGYLLDVAIGAAGSEVPILSDLQVGMRLPTSGGFAAPLPCDIPPGSRISARSQINQADIPVTSTIHVSLHAPQVGAPPTGSRNKFDVSPVSPSKSEGVFVGSNSTWVEVVASTPMPYRMLAVNIGGAGDPSWSSAPTSWDLAVGPSGGEVVVASGVLSDTSSEARALLTGLNWVCGQFPAGTRIAYRADIGATNAHTVNVTGVP